MHDAFWLSDEERQTRDLARTISRERVAPLAAEVDEAELYPSESLQQIAQAGLMGLYVPEAYGGTGLGALAFCCAVEEIAWACASTAVIYLVQYAAGYPIVSHGTDAQKRRYLPRLAAGEITAALSISEPGAGSDAASMTTTAVRKGDRYLLNGS
jgi:alkylation response protein AidB-like acyl-CoA dehydrogenase